MAKVRLGSYTVEKPKIMYCWSFCLLKMLKKSNAGAYSIGNAKIRYGCGFKFFKMLKEGMAVVLIFLKC